MSKMVKLICGLPEPPDLTETDSVTSTATDTFHDTDTDEEINEYSNYQPLPSNADDYLSEEDDSESENTAENTDIPGNATAESSLVAEVWTTQPPVDIEMDSTKIDEVKQVMLNVTLPQSSIPEWANNIPEDIWKERLLQRIQSGSDRISYE